MTPLEIASLWILWLLVGLLVTSIVLCWVVLLIGHLKGYPSSYNVSEVLKALAARPGGEG